MFKQVLIAVENLGGGGAERVAITLARHWPRNYAEPVLLVASATGEHAERFPDNIRVIEVGVSSSPRKTVPFLRALKKQLAGLHVTAVISHMSGMNRMLRRASILGILDAPVAVVEHNNFFRDQKFDGLPKVRRALLMREISFLYAGAHAVVGCSRGVADQIGALFSIQRDRLHAIENPLDDRFLRPTSLSPAVAEWFDALPRPVVVSVGRLTHQKGFDDMLRAFARVREGSLVILGEGPDRERLQLLAEELGISERLVMPGFLDAPEQVLQAADLYLSSSRWEGYPLTLVEAYASGLPVVAYDCDFGPAEIVRDGRPGCIVPQGDVDALARAIRDTLKSQPRFPVGTTVNLTENDPDYCARRYRALFA